MSENNTNQTQTQAQTQTEPEITLTLTPDELQEKNQKQLADLEAKKAAEEDEKLKSPHQKRTSHAEILFLQYSAANAQSKQGVYALLHKVSNQGFAVAFEIVNHGNLNHGVGTRLLLH